MCILTGGDRAHAIQADTETRGSSHRSMAPFEYLQFDGNGQIRELLLNLHVRSE